MTIAFAGVRTRRQVARLVTEVMAPIVLIVFVTVVVAIHAAGMWRGLLLAAVAVFFAGGLPYGYVLAGVRRGRVGDHHVSRLEERPAIFAMSLASVGFGLVVLHWLGAPRALFALVAAMVCGLAVALLVSMFWKMSIHAACAAGTVAVLMTLVNPWLVVLTPAVALTAWARVTLKDHTVAQVCVGAVVGAVIAAVVSLVLR